MPLISNINKEWPYGTDAPRAEQHADLLLCIHSLRGGIAAVLREATVYNGLLVLAAFLLPLLCRMCCIACAACGRFTCWRSCSTGCVLAAVSFASLFGGYELIPYSDPILHFLSGFLFAVLGTAVYSANKPGHALDPADAFNAALYTWMFAMMSAVLWEISGNTWFTFSAQRTRSRWP